MARRRINESDQAAITEIESGLLSSLPPNLSEVHKATCRRVAELRCLADKARRAALAGAAVNLDDVARLEDMAVAAAQGLPPANVVSRIEVELIEGPGDREDRERLKEENTALRTRLQGLESGNDLPAAASVDADTTVAQPSAPPDAPAARPPNMVPLRGQDMTAEQRAERVRQNKIAAGDRPQALQPPRALDGGFGASLPSGQGWRRFDFPDHGY
jgi:hypothetical protein